jgi:Domain of unknown function (DUF6438)
MEPARAAVRLALALAIAVALGCGGGKPRQMPLQGHSTTQPPRHEHLASMERTSCYGDCPVYKLTVYRDGVVEYEGVDDVKVRGKASGKLSAEELTTLEELFRKHGYLQLADAYEVVDNAHESSVYTAYTPAGGKRKEVKHHRGDPSAPKRLHEIEEGFDNAVKIEQWIGTREERRRLLKF